MRKIRTKNSNKRKLILNIFLFLFLLIGVGYSTVFTSLGINGDIILLNYRDLNIKQTSSTDRTAFRSDTYRENIKTITLSDSISAPSNVIESWDISENGSGGVMAYIVQNTTENNKYDLYIQGNGRIYTNKDSSYLFSGLTSLETINGLDKLTTTKTTNMSNMFSGDYGLTIADLSSFNMSKVISTTDMFNATDIRNITTPNVYPTDNNVSINLPNTLYDSSNNSYSTLNKTNPTQTTLYTSNTVSYDYYGGTSINRNSLLANYDGYYNNGDNHSNSTTQLKDLSMNGHDGTLNNVTIGKDYLEFNGANSWVNLGIINSTYQSIITTFEMTSNTHGNIIGNWEDGGGGIYVYPNGLIGGNYYIAEYNNYYSVQVENRLEMNKKYTVALTYDGTELCLYIDGNLEATNSISGTIRTAVNSTVMVLGTNPGGNNSSGEFFTGKIYSASIWNRALTAEEIRNEYGKKVDYGFEYGSLPTPTREGYEFLRWEYEPDNFYDSFTLYDATATYNNTGIYYTVKPNTKYTIKLDAKLNSGSATQFTTLFYDNTLDTHTVFSDGWINSNFGNNLTITYRTPPNVDETHDLRILIYSGIAGQTAGNSVTFSNIKVYEEIENAKVNNSIIVRKKNDHLLRAIWVKKQNNYDSAGNYTFNIPVSGTYKVELWGAQGGDGSAGQSNYIYLGGLGAYTSGIINLQKDTSLYIYVGGKGYSPVYNYESPAAGGYNGGGTGGYDEINDNASDSGGGGGGATDIRITNGNYDNFDSLKSRIMVAAGGGGGAWNTTTRKQGQNGGGLYVKDLEIGVANTSGIYVSDGTQISGYKFGIGQNQDFISGTGSASGGGGGGYYTGIVSTHTQGAGGTSFISGHNGCNAISSNSTETNITHTGNSNHSSGKVFTETVIIDGAGCKWTNQLTNDCSGQPQPDGTTSTGHSGNGYARITLISINN